MTDYALIGEACPPLSGAIVTGATIAHFRIFTRKNVGMHDCIFASFEFDPGFCKNLANFGVKLVNGYISMVYHWITLKLYKYVKKMGKIY